MSDPTSLAGVVSALSQLLGRLILPTPDGLVPDDTPPQPVNALDPNTDIGARDNNRLYTPLVLSDARLPGELCWRRVTINCAPQYHRDSYGRALMYADAVYLEALVDELHELMPTHYPSLVPSDSVRPATFIIDGVTFNHAAYEGTKALGIVSFSIDYRGPQVALEFREVS